MINLDLGTLIDKPVKDVFAFVANPNNMSKWNSAVVSLHQVPPGVGGVGTKFKSVGEMMGRRIEGEMQITTTGIYLHRSRPGIPDYNAKFCATFTHRSGGQKRLRSRTRPAVDHLPTDFKAGWKKAISFWDH